MNEQILLEEYILYTSKEICTILKISLSTLIRLRREKQIGSIKVGNQRRYTKKHLDNFLRKSASR